MSWKSEQTEGLPRQPALAEGVLRAARLQGPLRDHPQKGLCPQGPLRDHPQKGLCPQGPLRDHPERGLCQSCGWNVFCPVVPPARLQSGPQCGMVALALAASVRGRTVSPANIQALAVQRGFTAGRIKSHYRAHTNIKTKVKRL